MRIGSGFPVFSLRFFWIFLGICLIPWALVQAQEGTHSDLLWVSETLRRILDGGSMVESANDPNPPLSIFTYILPVMANRLFGIPLHYALFANSCAMVLVSALAIWAIIRRWPFLTGFDICALLAGYILANTVATSLMFGERDQYVGLALTPFVLLQIAMTFGLPYPKKLVWPVFLIGALFILLKPHHGLLPTLLLLHRAIHQKRWLRVMRDPDFVSLAVMTSGYLAVVWFFFHDYVDSIFPDVLSLYLPLRNGKEMIVLTMLFLYTGLVGGILTFVLREDRAKIAFIRFLIFAGMISLVPYYVQGMGFTYHLFPAAAFYMAAACLIVFSSLQRYARADLALCATTVILLVATYAAKPLNIDYPRHRDYARLPITGMVMNECAGKDPCSFFIFNKNMGIIRETSHYSGIFHASRFAAFWFLPTMIREERAIREGKESRLSPEELKRLRTKYSNMVAEDFERYKPQILFIWTGGKIDNEDLDFISYFSRSEEFAKQWKNYKKSGGIDVQAHDYYKNSELDSGETIHYDIYRRVQN
jgi:hypothetical protein